MDLMAFDLRPVMRKQFFIVIVKTNAFANREMDILTYKFCKKSELPKFLDLKGFYSQRFTYIWRRKNLMRRNMNLGAFLYLCAELLPSFIITSTSFSFHSTFNLLLTCSAYIEF